MKISRAPKKASTTDATDAWWYENPGSIDVIVQTSNGTFRVNIKRKNLADWIARSGKSHGR